MTKTETKWDRLIGEYGIERIRWDKDGEPYGLSDEGLLQEYRRGCDENGRFTCHMSYTWDAPVFEKDEKEFQEAIEIELQGAAADLHCKIMDIYRTLHR